MVTDRGADIANGILSYSWINCGEKLTPAQMYKYILIGIKMNPDEIDWNVIKDCKSSSPTVFIKKLREHYEDVTMVESPGKSNGYDGSNGNDGDADRRPQLVIVLDQADVLVQSDNSSFVNFIHSLPEVVSDLIAITIIMISRLPPLSLFNISYHIHSSMAIFFKSYTFNQTMRILKTIKPNYVTYSEDFYDK